jgi:hypothetical protein
MFGETCLNTLVALTLPVSERCISSDLFARFMGTEGPSRFCKRCRDQLGRKLHTHTHTHFWRVDPTYAQDSNHGSINWSLG